MPTAPPVGLAILQEEEAVNVDPTKFVAKKSKAAAKKGAGNSQWDILKMSSIPESEIAQVGGAQAWVGRQPGQPRHPGRRTS